MPRTALLTREHAHGDAGALALRNRARHLWPQGVAQADHANQNQILLQGFRLEPLQRCAVAVRVRQHHVLVRQRQHPACKQHLERMRYCSSWRTSFLHARPLARHPRRWACYPYRLGL